MFSYGKKEKSPGWNATSPGRAEVCERCRLFVMTTYRAKVLRLVAKSVRALHFRDLARRGCNPFAKLL